MKKKGGQPRTSLRDHINAKCRECLYDPEYPGSWVEQIGDCTSSTCPLFDVRVMTKKQSLKRRGA